jgi:hypothetical protein
MPVSFHIKVIGSVYYSLARRRAVTDYRPRAGRGYIVTIIPIYTTGLPKLAVNIALSLVNLKL